jgi:hypothetical protein
MSDATEPTEVTEEKKDFSVEIKISEQNLSYRSDFAEAETVFWLEAVKDLIIKNAFNKAGLEQGN